LIDCRDPLNRAAADAELLGDLVKPGATRRSQSLADSTSSLVSMKGRPQCLPPALVRAMLASPARGSSIARTRQTHPSSETLLCPPGSSCRCPADAGIGRCPGCAAPIVSRRGLAGCARGGRPTRPDDIEPAPRGILVHGVEARTLIPTLRARDAASRYTPTISCPIRSAAARRSRSWLSVVCSSVETRR
jgi:hypothetical protein